MMQRMATKWMTAALMISFGVGVGCDQETQDAVNDAADATGDAAEQVMDDAGEAIDQGIDAVGDAADDAAQAADDAVSGAGDEVDKAGQAVQDAADDAASNLQPMFNEMKDQYEALKASAAAFDNEDLNDMISAMGDRIDDAGAALNEGATDQFKSIMDELKTLYEQTEAKLAEVKDNVMSGGPGAVMPK